MSGTTRTRRPLRIGMLGLYGMTMPKLHFTGFETGFGEIAPRLAAMGHDVVMYCRRGSFPPDMRVPEYKGVRLVYVPSPGGKNFSGLIATFFATAHALATGRYQIYFFVNVGMGHHAALCRLFGRKVVMNVNGLDWTRAKWGPVARWYFLSAAHSAVRFCNELVTDADAMREFYRERFSKETTMIAYGAYVESSVNPEVVRQFGVEPDDYYLIASRLIPENHADFIAEAFLASGSPKKLLIAGGANYDSPFHRKLRTLAGDRVILAGHIDDQAVIRELHCNCFAYLHGHSVGGTNPSLLKAMGYGNCILALDTVFNREALADGGIFFPRDAEVLAGMIRDIESDPARVEALRRMGPERIRANYTWEKIANQYDELFREVASR
ncbi:MAG: glycosyltransferase [Gemmatimonadaceae bacterium]|nr:glycosyltransferase [Gemmatimonadaceae bacterium]